MHSSSDSRTCPGTRNPLGLTRSAQDSILQSGWFKLYRRNRKGIMMEIMRTSQRSVARCIWQKMNNPPKHHGAGPQMRRARSQMRRAQCSWIGLKGRPWVEQCVHRLETNLLQLFGNPENSEWFSIISVIIFEANIVDEQNKHNW